MHDRRHLHSLNLPGYTIIPLGASQPKVRKGRGRPRKIENSMLGDILNLLLREHMPVRKVAAMMGVSHMTIYRMLENTEVLI